MKLFLLVFLAFSIGQSAFAAAKITVGSAISMKEAMEQLAAAYMVENPTQQVALNFGSTASIVRQIQSGAPIDVFISADSNNIEVLTNSGHVAFNTASRIAGNEVLLITAAENNVKDALIFFESKTAGRIAVCDTSVPIGRYADLILSSMKMTEKIKHRKVIVENVRAAITMVQKRAVQAAFVYRTDFILQPEKLRILPFPATVKSSAEYFAASISSGKNPKAAAGFVLFLKSETAKKIFIKNGFQP